MDPLTVSAVTAALDKALGSIATEAGKSAWAALVRLVRSAFPDRTEVAHAALALEPGAGAGTGPGAAVAGSALAIPDDGKVIDLSTRLAGLAQADQSFAATLRAWIEQVHSVLGGNVSNVIADGATVHGNVVQARDIGSIYFG